MAVGAPKEVEHRMGMMKRMLERRPVFDELLERERDFVASDDRLKVTENDRTRWLTVAKWCSTLGWDDLSQGFIDLAEGQHD